MQSFVKPAVIVEHFSISLSFQSLGSEYGFGQLLLFVFTPYYDRGPRLLESVLQMYRCTHIVYIHMFSWYT